MAEKESGMSLSLAVNLASSALYAAGTFFSAREAMRRRFFAAPFLFLGAALGIECLVSVSNVLERIAAFSWLDRFEEYAEVLILPFVLVFAYSWTSAERLASNEAYVGELHHRVKNSLQIVESMLFVQAAASDSEEARSELAEARFRVSALGAAERLSLDSGEPRTVGMQAYLSSLAESIGSGVLVEAGGLALPTSQAASCGLVAAELILAARGSPSSGAESGGGPRLALRRIGEGRCAISFEGLSSPLPAFSEEMLKAMARKLGGELRLAEGTSLAIEFPDAGGGEPWRPASS